MKDMSAVAQHITLRALACLAGKEPARFAEDCTACGEFFHLIENDRFLWSSQVFTLTDARMHLRSPFPKRYRFGPPTCTRCAVAWDAALEGRVLTP